MRRWHREKIERLFREDIREMEQIRDLASMQLLADLLPARVLYLWDWSEIEDEGNRFENCVASHLLKMVNFLQDYEGYDAALHFLRDRDKREVDFLVTIDGKPWFACEAKLQDGDLSSHLLYFKDRLKIPFVYQVVKNYNKDLLKNGIRILPAPKFLAALV